MILKKNTIYNKDYKLLNKEILTSNKKIDFLLTDVPYNLEISTWDTNFNIKNYIKEVLPILEEDTNIVGIWCHLNQSPDLFQVMADNNYRLLEIVIWQKTNSLSKIKEEHCYIFTPINVCNVDTMHLLTEIEHTVTINNRIHSCQKPMEITEYIINSYTNYLFNLKKKPLLFLDNFCGSAVNIQALRKSPQFLRGNISYLASELHTATFKKSLDAIEIADTITPFNSILTILEEDVGYSKYTNQLNKDVMEDVLKLQPVKRKDVEALTYKRVLIFYILFNFNIYRYSLTKLLQHLKEDKTLAIKIADEMATLEDADMLSKHKYFKLLELEKALNINKQVIIKYKPKILNGKKRAVSLATRRKRYRLIKEGKDFENKRDYINRRKKATRDNGNNLIRRCEEELNLGIVATKEEFFKKYNINKSTYYYQVSKINDKIR